LTDNIVIQPQPRAWLERSVLQLRVQAYGEHLQRGRYAAGTQRVYLCCVAHFAHWLTSERYALGAVDEAAVARFMSEHLPGCECAYPVRRLAHELRAALARLLEVLRAEGAVSSGRAPSDSSLDGELSRFDTHMRDVCGLADSTRQSRRLLVGKFLLKQLGAEPNTLAAIDAAAVRRFVLGDGQGGSAGTVRVKGGAIACYLRFRAISGDPVAELLAAIPRAAHWRLAALPQVLGDAEIDELLRSFDQPFASRRRAYAMVRCLIDLGLRTREVIKLRLEDINWHDGTISLVGTKTRRADTLPLPAATGQAIASYLREERPSTSNRALFVRHVAPYDTPIEQGTVKRAVVNAYRRCGWTRSGVHILRHSVASRLLRAGAPMKDIADVLRHRSLDTSAIYVKIDFTRLAAVALPWPGSAS
jgi:integrase